MRSEPWTKARLEHAKHLLHVDGCEWCVRRLEENAVDVRDVIPYESTAGEPMDFCTLHGAVNCKQPSCFTCGNHALDDAGRCTDPNCGAATRLPMLRLDINSGILPTRAYAGDAGLDLYADEEAIIDSGKFADVPVGWAMALPEGYWARITGRSSGFRKRQFLIIEGVIDAGYRGPLYAGVWVPHGPHWNASDGPYAHIKKGDKIAQMLIHRVERLDPFEVNELPHSARGEKGFGSSGQ